MQLHIKDSSPLNRTALANPQVSLSASNGAGAYSLQVAYADTGEPLYFPSEGRFDFGTGDFTIEGYIYPTDTTTANNGSIGRLSGTAAWRLEFASSVMRLNDSGNIRITGATALTINTLHHWALTRTGTSVRLWLDGVQQGSTWTSALNWVTMNFFYATLNTVLGYYSELRITNGVGRYTAGFTPSYAAFPTGGGDANWASVVLLCKGDEGALGAKTVLTPPASVQGFAPTWPTTPKLLDAAAPILIRKHDFGGLGQIVGTVKATGTPDYPLARKVRLFRDRDGVCVAETWSNAAGDYVFVGFDPRERYSVVSYDYTGVFRAVIADNLLPTAYP